MTESLEQLEMFLSADEAVVQASELKRFYFEVGQEVVELGRMLRTPTETRPFIYELRLDLYPANASAGLVVVKGFGESGGLIAFQDGSGLVSQLRGLHGRFHAGKARFTEDKFQPGNYDKRVEMYLKDREYLAAKLPSR